MPKDVWETFQNDIEALCSEKYSEQSTYENSQVQIETPKSYHTSYYKRNKQRMIEKRKIYASKNKEKIKAYKKAYYLHSTNKFIVCRKTYSANTRQKNIEKRRDRAHYLEIKEKFIAYRKTYYAFTRENRKEYDRNYYLQNKEKMKAYHRTYISEHKEKHNAWRRDYYQENREMILEKKKNSENREKYNAKLAINREKTRVKLREPKKRDHKEYRQLCVFKLTGHSVEYFTNNQEEVRDCCKLKAEEMKQKQNRALLEAREKLKLENLKC